MTTVNVLADGGININCKVKGGMLVPAIAPRIYANNSLDSIPLARYCNDVGRYLIWAQGKTYTSLDGYSFAFMFNVAAQNPYIVEENVKEDGARGLIAGDTNVAVRTREYISSRPYENKLRCGVSHCGRVFGVDKTDALMLRWSGEGGLLDWTEGVSGAGWFYPEGGLGNILDVLSYNGKLLLLREYGLTVFKAAGTPENFAAERHISLTGIIEKTGAVTTNGVYFCTKNGIYLWKGGTPVKIDDALYGGLTPQYAVGYGEKYLVSGYHSAVGGNTVYIYDGADATSQLCDVSVTAICGGAEILAYGDKVYKLTEGAAPYRYTSAQIDFGTTKKKTMTALEISSDMPVDVKVENGVNSRIFRGVQGIIRPDLRGELFKITISGEGKIYRADAHAECDNAV